MQQPSVLQLAEDSPGWVNIPSIQAAAAYLDDALAEAFSRGDDSIEVVPGGAALVGTGAEVDQVMFLSRLLPPGFAELRMRMADGRVVAGDEFARMLREGLKKIAVGQADPETDGSDVHLLLDLNMLRAAQPDTLRPVSDRS